MKQYELEQVLPLIGSGIKLFDGDLINFSTQSLLVFKHKGIRCFRCNVHGRFFLKEMAENGKIYLRLYALNRKGHLKVMTKDHILPKSKGGSDCMDNYQPLCLRCNRFKSDKIINVRYGRSNKKTKQNKVLSRDISSAVQNRLLIENLRRLRQNGAGHVVTSTAKEGSTRSTKEQGHHRSLRAHFTNQ